MAACKGLGPMNMVLLARRKVVERVSEPLWKYSPVCIRNNKSRGDMFVIGWWVGFLYKYRECKWRRGYMWLGVHGCMQLGAGFLC